MYDDNPALVKQTIGDPLYATGVATAPGAGVAIATIAAPQKGRYRVCVKVGFLAGTPAAAEDNNFGFRRAATVIAKPATVRVINNINEGVYEVDVDGTQALSVNAVGAGTAAVVYEAVIVAQMIQKGIL